MPKVLWLYLVVVNLAVFFAFAVDKRRAIHGQWRIKESTLLLWCLLGGSVGGLLGMYLLRHKTRHPKFYLGIPGILILQLVAVIMVITYVLPKLY